MPSRAAERRARKRQRDGIAPPAAEPLLSASCAAELSLLAAACASAFSTLAAACASAFSLDQLNMMLLLLCSCVVALLCLPSLT